MPTGESTTFTRLTDGTLLVLQADGSFRPTTSKTDRDAVAALSDGDIERMASFDPDQPALDQAFWDGVDLEPVPKEAISIKLDQDILAFCRQQGRGYQTKINAVLRYYVDSRHKAE